MVIWECILIVLLGIIGASVAQSLAGANPWYLDLTFGGLPLFPRSDRSQWFVSFMTFCLTLCT